MSEKSIRIFISSPGDVRAERQSARQVIQHLQRKYSGRLNLYSIFWEEIPIAVHDAFQKGIDDHLEVLQKTGGIDIAIFILWSRLGSPTIELKTADGLREFPSGTVREWEYMMDLRRKNASLGIEGQPTIFLYTRKDEESYKRLLTECKTSDESRELLDQKDAVEAFIREKCKDPKSGKNTGAHLDYRNSDQGEGDEWYELPSLFKPKLRTHLMNYFDRVSGMIAGRPVWDITERGCPPFRGLDVFEVGHSLIFYGREDEIITIRAQLKKQSENGCAFVLIIGPSGSGKPSKKTFYFTLIIFPQGEYLIGSPEDETDRYKFIEVRHKVVLTRPFALLDREVTYDEMISFRRAPYAKRLIEGRKSLNVPCDEANWYDSVAFCRWLGKEMGLTETDQCYPDPETLNKEEYPRDPNVTWAPENWPLDLSKRGFRLPTKSEWEIAARSRSRTSYGFGSEVSLLDRFGWFTENSGKKVHPGREKRPSMRGMFDLHGNLFEWTHDCYAEYDDSSQTDPQGPNAGSLRVFRGGSCYDAAARCRSAYENCGSPSNGNYSLGFRVALSCPSGIPQSPEADSK